YLANLGAAISSEGTYYYASKFQYLAQSPVYGGFSASNGGFWDGTNNVSGVLTVEEIIPLYPVTFTITDLSESYSDIEFKGEMTSWNRVQMIESPAHTWTLTLDIAPGTYEWGALENDGSPDGIWLIDGANPVVTIASDGTISGTVSYTIQPFGITFANLQWPENGNIEPGDDFNVYAQVYAENVTDAVGQGAGVQAWIGYSTSNTNPSTWTNWIVASFDSDQANNDEYLANLGAAITTDGTYYYASRFQYLSQSVVYGGFSASGGGYWDGTNNVSGVLTVEEIIPLYPVTFTITDLSESYSDIEFKGEMTSWNRVQMIESPAHIWTLTLDIAPGTYEWGALENDGSPDGLWLIDGANPVVTIASDGTISGTVSYTIQPFVISFANLQWPENGNIEPGDDFNVYAQVYAENVTNAVGQGAGVQAWIGYSTSNTNPSTWTDWIPATFNNDAGNNDEYLANLGASITTEGTYYYASKFQYLSQSVVYGGFSASGGGYWDGT
ncbi:MAG: hypothetical protein FD166_3699, partial [Bacteroidetes bacterium]